MTETTKTAHLHASGRAAEGNARMRWPFEASGFSLSVRLTNDDGI
jgi:hypothetical protein